MRRTKPIPTHAYHRKSGNELRYIIKDAGLAAKCFQHFDLIAESKYLDQVNDACTVLAWRRGT